MLFIHTLSKSRPPRRGSPSTASTKMDFPSSLELTIETSSVPPPRSKTINLFLSQSTQLYNNNNNKNEIIKL